MNWFRCDVPPRWVIWLGGWLSLATRVRELERRVADLERRRA